MKRFILVLLGISLLGCAGLENFSLRPASNQTPAIEAEEDAAVETNFNGVPYTSPEIQLDEALGLYQDALDSAAAGNHRAAQNLYENAIISMTSLKADSLSIAAEDLEWLRWQLVEDYAAFLDDVPELPAESSPSTVYISLSEFLGDSIDSPEDLISRVLPTEDEPVQSDTSIYPQLYPDVPLVVNSYVERVLKFYQTKGRKVFSKWLDRAGAAIPYYTARLREEGLPEELVYLSMIESGFSTRAYSRAHASGPWQFIASTARIYDLEVDYWYDERRDPEKSTQAAGKYLKKLYDEFGDWYLAFAAYNSGERRVHRAMRRSGKKHFWGIRRYLPRQTRNYVPSYLAARIICQDPVRYGFDPISYKNPVSNSETVYVDGCIGFKDIAKCANTTESEIKKLNPALKRGCTPPNAKNFPIIIPSDAVDGFSEKIAKAPRLERTEWVRHRIRRGESLSTIAAKYGVSMRSIMEIPANKLRSPHKIRAGRYLLIPIGNAPKPSSRNYASRMSSPRPIVIPEGRNRTVYRVRKDDTLSEIAQKFGVRIADLKNWNGLWGKRFIYPGQKLTVWTKAPAESKEPDLLATIGPLPPASLKSKPQVHIVQSGDTLWDIGRLYGVSISNLKKWNNIYSARRLMPGTQLKLTP